MRSIILSDNLYLCAGVADYKITPCFIRNHLDIEDIYHLSPLMNFIIAIENDALRKKAIIMSKQFNKRYIVLMNEIEHDQPVKIDNVIYASLLFNRHSLQQLLSVHNALKARSFTRREYDVLRLLHLKNNKIARCLNISQKTISHYRISLQGKLNMRSTNTLAMYRIKSAII